ncbi:rab3 GTPase-activating protein catalytic subunit [Trifolium repens]|nr:rab3 GTPase-activating protein catalytic subunit [Trifolium repens]
MDDHGGNTSFVSKAKIVIHSAAAKAERVIKDFKSDLDYDKQLRDDCGRQRHQGAESAKNENESKFLSELKQIKWKPRNIGGTKQEWKDRINNIRKGRKENEVTEKVGDASMAVVPLYDEDMCIVHVKKDLDANISEGFLSVEGLTAAAKRPIPPSSVLKQLAIAVEAGRKANSMKDFAASSGDSSPSKERAGLSLTAVKALVLHGKEDKLASEFSSNEKVVCLICSLFDPEGDFLRRKINSNPEEIDVTSFVKDIHGAPPESLVVKLAEVIGNFKTLREMAFFWCWFVAELRKLWSKEKHLPGVPLDDIPDLKSCLLYQHFQVINCCISRKQRHVIATESLDTMMMKANSNTLESTNCNDDTSASRLLYARLSTGELVLRLGAHSPSGNMTLLETGEPAYSPITQEGQLLTEDMIKENEEFVLRTGSLGAGCSQLLSDMQAFKAANPGCIWEDFVRWYSPPDWIESEASTEDSCSSDGSGSESLSTRGRLSRRMQKEGNLWREFWETSKPVPAVKQAPLFDEDLAVEGILDAFEDIQPVELFGQLFVSLLGLGFTIAEPLLSGNEDFSKLFNDCKEYLVTTCQSIRFSEKVDELVQVYETVETMLLNPEEALKMTNPSEESTETTGETKCRFKKLSHIFAGKDKLLSRSFLKDKINDEEKKIRQSFSSFFDKKSNLFLKKPPKDGNLSPAETTPSLEDDWTIIQL